LNKFKKKNKVLILARKDAFNIENIVEFVSRNFDTTILVEERNSKLPRKIHNWSGDYIFSYLCPWVLPSNLIQNAKLAAINFHPGPPSYPGTGCYNFAIYHQEKEYGVTCHHLARKVDTGKIIFVKKFPLLSNDTVNDLIQRTYVYLNLIFYEIILGLLVNNSLPESDLQWGIKPYTKKALNELCKLSQNMSNEEIDKRIRATTFPGKPGPHYID